MQGCGGSLAGTPQNPLSGEQEAAPGLVLARRAGSGQELLWAPPQGAQPEHSFIAWRGAGQEGSGGGSPGCPGCGWVGRGATGKAEEALWQQSGA